MQAATGQATTELPPLSFKAQRRLAPVAARVLAAVEPSSRGSRAGEPKLALVAEAARILAVEGVVSLSRNDGYQAPSPGLEPTGRAAFRLRRRRSALLLASAAAL